MPAFTRTRKPKPPLEADVEGKDRKLARAAGWFVEKIMKAGRDGFPDRFYARAREQDICPHCMRGRIILIEWKRPGRADNGTSDIQDIRIAELRAAGVEVHVVDSLEEAIRIRGD
jgi:hypothetical protein